MFDEMIGVIRYLIAEAMPRHEDHEVLRGHINTLFRCANFINKMEIKEDKICTKK